MGVNNKSHTRLKQRRRSDETNKRMLPGTREHERYTSERCFSVPEELREGPPAAPGAAAEVPGAALDF